MRVPLRVTRFSFTREKTDLIFGFLFFLTFKDGFDFRFTFLHGLLLKNRFEFRISFLRDCENRINASVICNS